MVIQDLDFDGVEKFSNLSEDASPAGTLKLIAEDGSGNKYYVQVANLPTGTPIDNSITNTKLADMANATVKGRNTAGTGDPEDVTMSQLLALLGVEANATADQTDSEIETAYNNQVAAASQAEAEAGTVTSIRRFTPERIKQAIKALEGGEVITLVVTADDETVTAGTAKITYRLPFAMTLSAVRAQLVGAGSTSGTTTIDINEGGTTILSTKLTIDYGSKTSVGATTAAVISDSSLADDAEITIDVDAVTGGADEAGLKVSLIGSRT